MDKGYAIKREELTYTSVVTNTGSQKATNIIFKDVLQNGLSFVDNSVSIDGVNYPGLNPIDSFALSDLNAGESHTVIFKVIVE